MASLTETMAVSNRVDPILWVGDVSQIRLPQYIPFQKREVEIVFRASIAEALPFLRSQKYSVIVLADEESPNFLDFLIEAKQLQPLAPRLLVTSDLSDTQIREGINRAQVFRFMCHPITEAEIWEHLNKALQRHVSYQSHALLLKESFSQNRQLEALTHSLETMVEERTQDIKNSHQEESDKLNRERQLIRFIKDLAAQSSFEDILGVLRKELRKFHKMGDPILVFRLGGVKTYFLSFQAGLFTQSESLVPYEFPHEACSSSGKMIQYFANHFGRPFVKAYILPLEFRMTSQFAGEETEALLCIENSLNDKEMPVFLDYIGDRMGPLSMALDRVLLENQLSVFSYRWEKTFDGMKDPIAIVDSDYNVIRSNRKFSDKFLQAKCFETFAGRTSPCESCPAQAALKSEQPQIGEINVQGHVFQVHSYPVMTDQGAKPTNWVNQYVDITQSRELYLRMLQNEKMGAIGMLAGHIAHELNNPLTGIRALTQVMQQEVSKDEALYSDLSEIEKAAGRSQRIIKNLLEFSKGENQPLEVVSIDEVLEKTLPMLKSALRNHRLEVDLKTQDFMVLVEPHLLQQVFFNLINNACQAMQDHGRVEIRSWVKDHQVCIEISDTGSGIPEDIQRRIFEPFFTTKKEGHGTGLGLSMSRSIVEKFGGQIEVKNREVKGSCFTILLPQYSDGVRFESPDRR